MQKALTADERNPETLFMLADLESQMGLVEQEQAHRWAFKQLTVAVGL
jgi:hypothetical protein